jgi:hypothetical protein
MITGYTSHARLARAAPSGFLDVDKVVHFATRTAQASRTRCASRLRSHSFGRKLRGWCFAPAPSAKASTVGHFDCGVRVVWKCGAYEVGRVGRSD